MPRRPVRGSPGDAFPQSLEHDPAAALLQNAGMTSGLQMAELIEEARRRIVDHVYLSPCARSEYFSRLCGLEAYFKLENLQMTGSFKERGALNRILTLSEDERRRGLITASAGNHGQAVAYHAGRLGLKATVVMPLPTPLIKVANTRSFGADVRLAGETFDDAQAHAHELEAEVGATYVHPFDDVQVIAGQGTIGFELMAQEPDLEVIVVPVGGGGLISGIAAAYKAHRPQTRIVGVQTQAVPSMRESLAAGGPVAVDRRHTIADGIAVKRPADLTLKLVEELVDDLVTVDEEEIANAVLLLLEREKAVVEGAGAAVLAAVVNDHVPQAKGRRTAMVLTGGNIDVTLLNRIIERGLTKDGRLVQLDVCVKDRPGALGALLNLVGDAGANVIETHHERAFTALGLNEVHIELRLETRGPEHVEELIAAIAAAGLHVRRQTEPQNWHD